MSAKIRSLTLTAVLSAILAACAPQLPPSAAIPAPPADFPEAYYRQGEARGGKVMRVDAGRSLVTIEVRRAGALAHLGHDHVVASHEVTGYIAADEGRADLYVRLDRLVVDEPELRAVAGFDTQPSAEAVEGTRRNMLAKVLDSERFPFALIRINLLDAEQSVLGVSITLHGTRREFDVPVQIDTLADGIAYVGKMSFKQSDFGIVPMSVLGGALQVEDQLDLRFRIVARGG